MSGRNWRTSFLVITVACALGACSFGGAAYAQTAGATSDATPIDDGWRRTSSGWEQSFAWQTTAASTASTWRVDFHPGALALMQALVIAAAFRVFSAKNSAGRNTSPDPT